MKSIKVEMNFFVGDGWFRWDASRLMVTSYQLSLHHYQTFNTNMFLCECVKHTEDLQEYVSYLVQTCVCVCRVHFFVCTCVRVPLPVWFSSV